MKLEKIICLTNRKYRLLFNVMERSLRASGCDLPLLVIPYDDDIFELPKNASWWEVKELSQWLANEGAVLMCRKYQALLESNYQYIDVDICVLRDPAKVLAPYSGFVASCAYWHTPNLPCTPEAIALYKRRSTTWAKSIFCAGQFACDSSLYDLEGLIDSCKRTECRSTCLDYKPGDEPGTNLLVFMSKVPITNLTLPPLCMESPCPADYPVDVDPQTYWTDQERKPYLLHFLGHTKLSPHPLKEIFHSFLTVAERAQWEEEVQTQLAVINKESRSLRGMARRVRKALKLLRTV